MLDKVNVDIKRSIIVAIYILVGILFTGLIPGFQPVGILAIIAGIAIGITLFEVWNYQPNGKTKPIFWLVFLALIGIGIYCFKPFIQISHWWIVAVLVIISYIIGKKEWM